ncbi:MarR family winged helix-turn-helix transcriptional regulator [Mobilicoccus caccae]|uniref:HTH marR-type domain-containing protein n=1 Tax=Mobilicoccus caccae TaxID=1859295 RepID=A0ABQ6IXS5_9MICO|nr:MarR family transcriptional regulator [Mobilicoccus caccae]GMA41957.1 hypothetical protein GCM10025883_40020 [Mobilicoccus caccae]
MSIDLDPPFPPRDLARLMIRAADAAKHAFADAVATEGLTAQQARVVFFLGEPRQMKDLADHLHCDASNVTGIADRLTRAGWVTRVPGQDRRVKLLTLTEEGAALRRRLGRAVMSGPFPTDRLAVDEQEQLGALLQRMLEPAT